MQLHPPALISTAIALALWPESCMICWLCISSFSALIGGLNLRRFWRLFVKKKTHKMLFSHKFDCSHHFGRRPSCFCTADKQNKESYQVKLFLYPCIVWSLLQTNIKFLWDLGIQLQWAQLQHRTMCKQNWHSRTTGLLLTKYAQQYHGQNTY